MVAEEQKLPEFNTPFLNHYLKMVEETESPRIFHIWAAVGALASALGRRNWFPFGHSVIYPNQYIVMVGTPGTRKSTVLSIARKKLEQSTGVKFAPDDTAGQRQGLIKAMMRNSETPELYLDGVKLDQRDDTLAALTMREVSELTDDVDEVQQEIDEADRQHLLATSDEFSRFIGQNSSTMLDFLTSTWDGRSYTYETTTKEIKIKSPLLNVLGCTTPVSIANSMPPAAGGQGFLSRVILVYGAKKFRYIPRPREFPVEYEDKVRGTLNEAFNMLHGAFEETGEARSFSETLYDYPLEISDSRFGYYHERRYTHLIKLAMALCAGRESHVIVKDDYIEAHRILRATERGMPDALGEFGMNPLAALKQSIIEFMRESMSMPLEELRGHFHRDARANEFMEVINDLIRTRQLVLIQSAKGGTFVSAKITKADTEDTMLKLLAES